MVKGRKAWLLVFVLIIFIVGCKSQVNKQKEKKQSKISKPIAYKPNNSHFGFNLSLLSQKEKLIALDLLKEAGSGYVVISHDNNSKLDYLKEADELVKKAQANGQEPFIDLTSFNSELQQPNSTPVNLKKIKKIVERYDGDGLSDMAGLKKPIIYWTINDLFASSVKQFPSVLIIKEVKKANSAAKIIYYLGESNFEDNAVFDIAVWPRGFLESIEIAAFSSKAESSYLKGLKNYLEQAHLKNKSIWLLGVQLEDKIEKKEINRQYASSMIRAYSYALANGAQKLFYNNFITPKFSKDQIDNPGISAISSLISDSKKQDMFYAYQNYVKLIDKFSEVKRLKEVIKGKNIEEGQYLFTVQGKKVYVLWGTGSIPAEIKGQVKLIDVLGKEKTVDASVVKISYEPQFMVQ